MRVHNVSYDLKKPGQNYVGLIEELKASPSWWHYLGSTWLIATNETAHQLFERLRSHIDGDDRVLVIRVRPEFSGWLPEEAWEWIRENVSRAVA